MIHLDQVSKRYQLGEGQQGLRSLPGSLLRSLFRHTGTPEQSLWALKNVSFSVQAGEAVGIVGRNGAGKTTILKLLSRITQPTSGRLTVNGRVSALIELGAGFHPDLTGLENTYLYGAILGLRRRDIDRKMESIVEFSGLAPFMDTPVKRYSSGMYARLAFSVAAHVDPEILLVDEVLAVGDYAFQQKCLDFIHSFVRSGNTTIFISHNLYAVEQLCDRLVWLDHGEIVQMGDPGRVLDGFLDFMQTSALEEIPEGPVADGKLRIRGMRVTDAQGLPRDTFVSGEDVAVEVNYEAEGIVERPHFCIWVSASPSPDPLFAANMLLDGNAPDAISGRGTVRCVLKRLPLMPRVYYVWVEVYGADRAELLFRWQRMGNFRVIDPVLLERISGQRGGTRFAKSHGPIRIAYEWEMGDAEADDATESVGARRSTTPIAALIGD